MWADYGSKKISSENDMSGMDVGAIIPYSVSKKFLHGMGPRKWHHKWVIKISGNSGTIAFDRIGGHFIWFIKDQNGFRPKSLKACNAELAGVCTCFLNEPEWNILFQGGSGGPPPEFFFLASEVANGAFHSILGHCTPNTPTPSGPPLQKFPLQIYTDLKNGPGSWKKVWNQTIVWFWSLFMMSLPVPPSGAGISANPGWYCHNWMTAVFIAAKHPNKFLL